MGGAYYVKQEGIPFIGQQDSFSNVNNANNTEGITDGISNPLDNVDNDDDDDSSSGAAAADMTDATVVAVDEPVAAVSDATSSDIFASGPIQPVEPVQAQTDSVTFDDFGSLSSPQPVQAVNKEDDNLFSVPLGDSTTTGSLI